MRFAVPRRPAVVLTCIAILGSGCGGDSTGPGVPGGVGQPQPPAGSATQVPRVLGLSTIDGKSLPAMHYTSSTYDSDAWTDSGSATLQGDSMLVIRTYTRWVDHGAGSSASSTPDQFTTAGRLHADGTAVLSYTDGTADTAHVLANGAIQAHLTIDEKNVPQSYGTFLFARAYAGGTLNPIPAVRAISPDTAPEYADSEVVTITGSSLLPTTRATWDNSTSLPVKYLNPYQITITIPAQDLVTAGAHALALINPPPGGGERIYQFPVTIPEPAIMSISPTTMLTSGGDFTLQVKGRGFIQGKTQVLWNGSPRAATVSGPRTLTATISNADIATPGTYQVAVQTLPPGGGTSGVISMTVAGTPAQKYSEVSATFGADALVVDPTRPLVYALPNSFEPTYQHGIVAIDPTSGNLVWTLDLGVLPTKMAVADDGSYLYAVAGDTVFRVALATHTIALRIPIPRVGNSWVSALAVMPGQPQTVAMQYQCFCDANGLSNRLEIYDDAQMRTDVATLYGTPGPIVFTSPTMLHAFTSNAANDLTVTPTGVTIAAKSVAQIGVTVLAIDGTRAFTGLGEIYDLATHTKSKIPGMTGGYAVTLSSDGSMMYAIDASTPFVRAYDAATGNEVGAVSISSVPTELRSGSVMVRLGTEAIAFTSSKHVIFIRADFVH